MLNFLSDKTKLALKSRQLDKIAADMTGVPEFNLPIAIYKLASAAYIKRHEDELINAGLDALDGI